MRAAGAQGDALRDRERASRAVREYFDVLDWEDTNNSTRRSKPPKALSLTDPLAAWVAKQKVRAFFAYDANYLIDNALGVIVDAEGSRANRLEENRVAVAMVARVADRFDLTPKRLAADTAYGSGKTLKELTDRGIEAHIPVWDKSTRTDETFSRADFTYDEERDVYICPSGKTLKTTGKVHDERTLYYRSRKPDCEVCALKQRCCPNTPARRIPRDIDEDVRNRVRALAHSEAFEQSRRERKKVEMAFAQLKRILKLYRLRLRGLSDAQDEILLAATAQNLRKLVKYAGPAAPRMTVLCAA